MALVHYTYGAINCTGRQRLFADGQTIIVTVYGHVLNDAEAPGVLATRPVIGFDANPIVRRASPLLRTNGNLGLRHGEFTAALVFAQCDVSSVSVVLWVETIRITRVDGWGPPGGPTPM